MFQNIPKVKIGIVAVSRDCFPESLSVNRRTVDISKFSKFFSFPRHISRPKVYISPFP